MSEKEVLEEGSYECSATLHIKDGKALVILHSMFNLAPGTAIPLLRKDHDLVVQLSDVGQIGIRKGHAII